MEKNRAPSLASALDYPSAIFSTRVLNTNFEGLKAAWIGSALSKFRPSVEDGATYGTPIQDKVVVHYVAKYADLFLETF